MNFKWNKLITLLLTATVLNACNCADNQKEKLYKRIVDLESEFWFERSTSQVLLNRIIAPESQIVWSTNFHTAAPVPIGAVGPEKYTEKLKGIIHNDLIGRVLKEAVNDQINVILVIGDGMGNSHMSLPVYKRYAEKNNEQTMFEKIMKEGTCGYVYTSTSSGLVTGSAASGTAIACGIKTRMNMIGVDPEGRKLESALAVAKRKHYLTALVTDAGITDATPAVFYAHSVNRNLESQIASQLLSSQLVDVILGGGGGQFIPEGSNLSDYFPNETTNKFVSVRKDTLNLIRGFQQQGYNICFNLNELQTAPDGQKVIGLFAGGGLPAPIDRDESTASIPSVEEMSKKALKIISKQNTPYFSMIECARIDWEAHDNDFGAVYQAVEDMNQVLKIAYHFYQQNPKKTLLIFTADHETGGLEIAYRKMKQPMSKKLASGDVWESKTNPLAYEEYLKILKRQKKSVSRILMESHSIKELRENLKENMGIELSNEDAELLFYTQTNYKSYKD